MAVVEQRSRKSVTRALPKVRRMNFRFGEPAPMKKHYVEGDIVFSHLVSLLSGVFPPGEESFIRSVRNYSDQITDPVLKKRVAAFIGQEAMHGREHRKLNDQIVNMGYPLVRLMNFEEGSRREKFVLALEKRIPKIAHLAGTAAAEHYTAVLAERVLSSSELQEIPMSDEVHHLLNWHAMEEMEHKSVAFDVYRAVGGPESVRIGVMSAIWLGTLPVMTLAVLGSILTDRSGWKPVSVLRQTIDLYRGPLVKGLMRDIAVYLRPGFHPDDVDTNALLDEWQKILFGAEGELNDRLPTRATAAGQ
ncbi:metal-dependent hydrolase [Mycobacterium sp. NPDC050853]|uniref:metal-dependent hydrolase n=1 Tax=Mycobacteriaceae TaxID=1762 RepID=UPI0015E04F56|nr:metal-dependent hydrolase [Mycobacteroides sp. LB1]